MKTTDYLDEIKKAHPDTDGKPASDYRVAKLLGIGASAISKYRLRGTTFDDEVAAKAGALLGMPTYIVIADMHSERARKKGNKEVMMAWDEITKKLSGTAAGIMMAVAVTLPNQGEAGQFNITKIMPSTYPEYILYRFGLFNLPLAFCRLWSTTV